MSFETVWFDEERGCLAICDQTRLPGKIEYLYLREPEQIWEAIYLLKVRGAPAIGVAAAIGIYTVMSSSRAEEFNAFYQEFLKVKEYLNSSRPTAVNLSWALNRMDRVCKEHRFMDIPSLKERLKAECLAIRNEDIAMCRAIGEHSLSLVRDGDTILTHCNAGRLATVKYGTATSLVYLGLEKGVHLNVYCDETRPLLQGARLTAFELAEAGVPVTLECDGMSYSAMKQGKIDAVFVGADRIAANGDFANKIGTAMLALAAKRCRVPFYCCAPTSSIDMSLRRGDEIVIEQRAGEEVTDMWYSSRMAPENIEVFNPAFDVTDCDLVSGIVTEKGIARYPFTEDLKRFCSE